MTNQKKEYLMNLGVEILADALLEAALYSGITSDLVDRILATPEENIKRFNYQLANLRTSRHYYDWSEVHDLADELELMLTNLEAGVTDPKTGVELMVKFFEMDEVVFEMCDDSGGSVGDVFMRSAKELFVAYASEYEEKKCLRELVLDLVLADGYGVRDCLLDSAAEFLPEEQVRAMIEDLRRLADKEKNNFSRGSYHRQMQSLARQIKDASLFKSLAQNKNTPLSPNEQMSIARVYLESGDPQTALEHMQKIKSDTAYGQHDRDELMFEIYGKLGDKEQQTEIAWAQFKSYRSDRQLERLLDLLGHHRREEVIVGEIPLIHEESRFSFTNTAFLIETGYIGDAARYIFERHESLDGGNYYSLPPLAEAMQSEGYPLAASVIYRSLIDSILERGKSPAYHHGVSHLRALDKMADTIEAWEGIESHTAYKETLRKNHGRKWSFWAKYEA